MRSALALAGLVMIGSAAALASGAAGRADRAADDVVAAFDAQLAVIARTDELLADKYQERARELQRRVRAAYKLLRGGWAPLWVDPGRRAAVVQRRALVQRALSRTATELDLLRAEVAVAARARTYLEDARQAARTAAAPAPGSLLRPVTPGEVAAGFGIHRHHSGARLTRRGVELASAPGAPVRAPAAGVVRYAGPVRGLGNAVIVAHDGFLSVLARLDRVTAQRGAPVERGAELARAAGARVYLEIRLDVGGGGHPVDPAPLLAPAPE